MVAAKVREESEYRWPADIQFSGKLLSVEEQIIEFTYKENSSVVKGGRLALARRELSRSGGGRSRSSAVNTMATGSKRTPTRESPTGPTTRLDSLRRHFLAVS